MSELSVRLATTDDLPALRALMEAAIDQLQSDVLTQEQVKASHAIMGLDTQLIDDQTYFIVECGGQLAGCGGWSKRATLYGGDHTKATRNPKRLDPAREAARVRAMYTHPDFVRRGVGSLVLACCEQEAYMAGFKRAELMATLAGEKLYAAAGYRVLERTSASVDGVTVPLVRMEKPL
ncbi:MAG TPA: GNAT family N-acetyltransferase [Burkholderiaceae bacterium]